MAERGPFRDDPLVEEGKGLGHLLLRHVQQFRGVGGELQGTKVLNQTYQYKWNHFALYQKKKYLNNTNS